MFNRIGTTVLVPALALGAVAFAGQAQAATYTFGAGSWVDANSSSDGLQIQTKLRDLSSLSFDLDKYESKSFALFDIWTCESELDHDDKEKRDIDFFLDINCVDELVHIDGYTEGEKDYYGYKKRAWGEVKWEDCVIVELDCVKFRVELCEAVFNYGKSYYDYKLDEGWNNHATVYAKITQLNDGEFCCTVSTVPTPSAAGAGLFMAGLGLLRRRRRAA